MAFNSGFVGSYFPRVHRDDPVGDEVLLSKRWECGFADKISATRQKSADGAADLRRRAAPSARTRHGGDAGDAAEEIRLRAKPGPRMNGERGESFDTS